MIQTAPLSRRAAVATLLACASAGAWPQDTFPTQAIRIVNTFPPGGPSDLISRAVAEHMTKMLKQPVIVDNKPGAAGSVGAAEVARSPADGTTVMSGIDTTFTVNPSLYKSMPFKPDALKPLMIMATSGLLIGVQPALGVKTLAELVARAKTDNLFFSSGGNGSPGHLAATLFGEAAGAKVTHVPYKGNTPAVTAMLAGEVQSGILATPGLLPHVQAGKITALAVTSRQRSPLAPDVPTVAEAGLKALEFEVHYVAMIPAATPAPVVEVLRRAMADALDQPAVQQALTALDLVVDKDAGSTAQDRLAALRSRYAKVIKDTGMTVE